MCILVSCYEVAMGVGSWGEGQVSYPGKLVQLLAQTPWAYVVFAGSASQHGASLGASGIFDEAFSPCS